MKHIYFCRSGCSYVFKNRHTAVRRCVAGGVQVLSRARHSHADLDLDPRNRFLRPADESTNEKQRHVWLPPLLGFSGLGLLAYSHLDVAILTDAMGVSLVMAAVVSVGLNSKHKLRTRFDSFSKRGNSSKFHFKVINDRDNFSIDAANLENLLPVRGKDIWPEEVQEKLKALRKSDELIKKDEISRRKENMLKIVSDEKKFSSEAEALCALAPRVFVLDFIDPLPPRQRSSPKKDTRSRAELLGEEVSLLISCATNKDVVIINLTSPGGSVIEYGLAASHLLRLKKAGIKTIVTVDKVAASGGFMMACCADEVVAAPFAYLGSIGVIAEVPNFNRVLEKNEIDYFMFTAGKFKRTVSLFNAVSNEGKEKFQAQLESIHEAFKTHVSEQRGEVMDVEKVSTGEAWLALQCKEYGLVDRLDTSHDVIRNYSDEGYDVIKVERIERKNMFGGLSSYTAEFVVSVFHNTRTLLHQFFPRGYFPTDTSSRNAFGAEDQLLQVNELSEIPSFKSNYETCKYIK